jgi:hypothetical protein
MPENALSHELRKKIKQLNYLFSRMSNN